MPVWAPEADVLNNVIDPSCIRVLGSREDIYQLDQTGSKILEKRVDDEGKTIYRDTLHNQEFDLHRPFIDKVW